jgi:hypothetical protein
MGYTQKAVGLSLQRSAGPNSPQQQQLGCSNTKSGAQHRNIARVIFCPWTSCIVNDLAELIPEYSRDIAVIGLIEKPLYDDNLSWPSSFRLL